MDYKWKIGNYLLGEIKINIDNIGTATYLNTVTGECSACKIIPMKYYCDAIVHYNKVELDVEKILIGLRFAYVIFPEHYGKLSTHIATGLQYTEETSVKNYFSQMIEIVANCHSNGLAVYEFSLDSFNFSDGFKTSISLHAPIMVRLNESRRKQNIRALGYILLALLTQNKKIIGLAKSTLSPIFAMKPRIMSWFKCITLEIYHLLQAMFTNHKHLQITIEELALCPWINKRNRSPLSHQFSNDQVVPSFNKQAEPNHVM